MLFIMLAYLTQAYMWLITFIHLGEESHSQGSSQVGATDCDKHYISHVEI